MHLLTTSSTGLDEIVEAVDLGQPPGDIAILSFADSDLAALATAWEAERAALPSLRLAHLRDLRHPMSVDLWIDRVGAHAKVIPMKTPPTVSVMSFKISCRRCRKSRALCSSG